MPDTPARAAIRRARSAKPGPSASEIADALQADIDAGRIDRPAGTDPETFARRQAMMRLFTRLVRRKAGAAK